MTPMRKDAKGRPLWKEPRESLSQDYIVVLRRPLRVTDAQVIADPIRNPRWFAPGSRTLADQTPEEFGYALFSEQSTERLYEILDGHYLLVIDGRTIHRILMERDAWDARRIGETSTFVPGWELLPAAGDRVRETIEEWAKHFDDTLTALKESAA